LLITGDEYLALSSIRPQEAEGNVKVQATVHGFTVPEHSTHLPWVVPAPSGGFLGQQGCSHAYSAWKLAALRELIKK